MIRKLQMYVSTEQEIIYHGCHKNMSSLNQNGMVIKCVPVAADSTCANGSLPHCSLMMARGVAAWARGDAARNAPLQTTANQTLLVGGKQAEDLERSNQRDAAFTTVN